MSASIQQSLNNFIRESWSKGRTGRFWRHFSGQAILAYQGIKHFTRFPGLEFSYTVKHKKNGDYSGELLISRKETSKTLTRSSVMLAFHKVLAEMKFKEINGAAYLLPPEYRGPKSIGQIFGISYIFSMFLEFGLIRTNEKDKIEKAKAEKVR